MLIVEAQVETERPSRYLVQLCRHFNHKGRHLHHRPRSHLVGDMQAPPEVRAHVEWSDTYGIVSLNWGQCTMQATPHTLTLRAEATDGENLQRVQDLVAGHLERFGRRDHLKVNWRRPSAPTVQPSEGASTAPKPPQNASPRREHRKTVVLTAAGALAVAMHLGLGGAVLAVWMGWTTGIVFTVVLVTVVAVTVTGLRRLATRRSKTPTAPNEK